MRSRLVNREAATLAPCSTQSFGRLEKVIRVGEDDLKRLQHAAAYVTSLEPDQALSDAELRARTADFRLRLENGESLDEILFEAFAAVREARVRPVGSADVRRAADGRNRPARATSPR